MDHLHNLSLQTNVVQVVNGLLSSINFCFNINNSYLDKMAKLTMWDSPVTCLLDTVRDLPLSFHFLNIFLTIFSLYL